MLLVDGMVNLNSDIEAGPLQQPMECAMAGRILLLPLPQGFLMTVTSDTETWMLTDEQLTARVALAFKTKAQAEAQCATLMAAVQDRDLVSLAGASSPTSWLTNLTGVARGEASRTVRQADNLNTEVEPTLLV